MESTLDPSVNTHRQMSKVISSMYTYIGHSINFKMIYVSLVVSPFVVEVIKFVEKYIFRDWNFLAFLCILWLIDTVAGTWAALKLGIFKPSLWFEKMFTKTVVYILWIMLFGAFQSSPATAGWLDKILGITSINVLMITEFLSAGKNLLIIRPDTRLKTIVDKVQSFFNKSNPPTTP